MRMHEVYSLICWSCENAIEIPCKDPHVCPRCGVKLVIEFRPAEGVTKANRFPRNTRAR